MKVHISLSVVGALHCLLKMVKLIILYLPYRFPGVFGDKFCDKFGDEFGDSLILVTNLVTNLVIH